MTPKIYLKKNEERRIKNGHLWIFSNEINNTENNPDNGDIVDVYDSRKNLLGTGFYNKNSLISVRILSNQKIENLEEVLRQRVLTAYDLRKQLYPGRDSYRLVFSESDFLPGLIIDKYNSTFVLQVYSFGMQKNINIIVKILTEDFGAQNIFTKNESYFRMLEGLPQEDEILLGEMKIEIISDGLISYKIDFEKTQKTGFYFDQSENRSFVEKISRGKTVLDAFCNSGGFGLHAASAGAESITFVDSSSTEIENAKVNFELNNFKDDVEFVTSDVFDYLEKCISENKQFDIVMIDPPAFAKNKKSLHTAKKGYEKLNRLAIQTIIPGGYLVSSSCSHHLIKDEFLSIINTAAVKAGKNLQLIHFYEASLDHPKIPSMNETAYLKFAVYKIFV